MIRIIDVVHGVLFCNNWKGSKLRRKNLKHHRDSCFKRFHWSWYKSILLIGPPALLREPWRSHIEWTSANKYKLLEDINRFKVKGGIQYLNCFLLGQAASGKTSFFNTSATALKDERRILAPLTVFKSSGKSVTTRVNAIDLSIVVNWNLYLPC